MKETHWHRDPAADTGHTYTHGDRTVRERDRHLMTLARGGKGSKTRAHTDGWTDGQKAEPWRPWTCSEEAQVWQSVVRAPSERGLGRVGWTDGWRASSPSPDPPPPQHPPHSIAPSLCVSLPCRSLSAFLSANQSFLRPGEKNGRDLVCVCMCVCPTQGLVGLLGRDERR